MSTTDLRNQVADVLESLCILNAPLHIDAPHATWRLHSVLGTDPHDARYQPRRLRLHQALIEEYLSLNTEVATDGSAAAVTAGPPGVGKSTQLEHLGYDRTWRQIDSDVFKTMLIRHDLIQGSLVTPPEVSKLRLPDGGQVLPLELSGLYHRESTVVADKAQQICLEAHENIVIEGTLSWDGLASQITRDLTTHGYERLDIVLVEAPFKTALDQALARWWRGRLHAEMGGRFTPAAAIRALYVSPTASICAKNAEALERDALSAGLVVTIR